MLIKKNCIPGYIWIIPLYQPSQAPSTSIRIFLNPQLFLSGFKNVHVHTYRIQIETYPKRIWIHFSTQDSSGNIGNRACVVKRAKFASCFALREPGNEVAILNTVYSSPDKKKSGFSVHTIPDSQRIQKFALWKADSKSFIFLYRIHRIRDTVS